MPGKGVTGGSLDFNLISLFPPTYKNRPNGLRPDLMELLRGLKPVSKNDHLRYYVTTNEL